VETALGSPEGATPLERATAALEGVHDDPHRTLAVAREVLGGAEEDQEAAVIATWAIGLAHRELNDVAAACSFLRSAVVGAGGIEGAELQARIRMSLSAALSSKGLNAEAFAELDAAASALAGTERGRALMQRGLLHYQLGQIDDAIRCYDAALPPALAGGDRLGEARLRVNRALALSYAGRFPAAENDLLVAGRLAEELGQKLVLAVAEQNLGFVASQRGDVPEALRWYERARTSYQQLDDPDRLVALLDNGRCEVLLAAGLASEAMAAAARSVASHARAGNELELAEAELLLGHAQLMAGRFAQAAETAERGRDRFQRSDRFVGAALAGYIAIQATVLDPGRHGPPGGTSLRLAIGLAEELDRLGWKTESLHVRSFAARIALEQGDVEQARLQLRLAARARQRGPAAQRVQAWHAVALLRHIEGNDAGARRALEAGLRLVDVARSGLGSSELRATVARHGADLTALGLQLALAAREPRRMLAWVERSRALALLSPPARPPDDGQHAAELAALRQARADARDRLAAGMPAAEAKRRIDQIEQSIRGRAREASGAASPPGQAVVRHDLSALADRVLLEYVQADGHLVVLGGRDGRLRLLDLGPWASLDRDVESLGFAFHRLARQASSSASRALALRTIHEAAGRIADVLVRPLLGVLGDRSAVVVPDPALQRVPWAALPGLQGRPLSVSPSLRVHSQAVRAEPPDPAPATLLVAGPGLPGAVDEVERLREVHPGALVLAGAAATVDAVSAALGDSRLAHLACHGRARADNPLFSSLTLADGELTVYDLERCGRVASTIVLSACYSGVGTAVAGTEVLGLSTALFSLGCSTVVAPVAPVSDAGTTAVMVGLHEGLRRQERPSTALAAAAAGLDGEAWAGWAAFAAFGAG
jgi:tetratricopeptide (TPR) repeat protein